MAEINEGVLYTDGNDCSPEENNANSATVLASEVVDNNGSVLCESASTIYEDKVLPMNNAAPLTEESLKEPDVVRGEDDMKGVDDEAADIFIKSIVPYKLIFSTNSSGREVALLIYLCTDDSDNLFTIYTKVAVKNEEHKEFLSLIPFTEDEDIDFVNEKACTNMIMASLDNYTCDMVFTLTHEECMSKDPVLRTKLNNLKTSETITASITSNNFAAVTFIDHYLKDMIHNEHDLALATVAGFKTKDDIKAEFFKVYSLDILAMAPAEVEYPDDSFIDKISSLFGKKNRVKHSDSLAVVARFTRPKDGDVETCTVLIPFNVGGEFAEEKFRGETVENIENTYYKDGDQYVSTLYIDNCYIDGLDKTYTIIRAKSKSGNIKIFLLDTYAVKSLEEKINEY